MYIHQHLSCCILFCCHLHKEREDETVEDNEEGVEKNAKVVNDDDTEEDDEVIQVSYSCSFNRHPSPVFNLRPQ